jgi:hypothetical protein
MQRADEAATSSASTERIGSGCAVGSRLDLPRELIRTARAASGACSLAKPCVSIASTGTPDAEEARQPTTFN